MEHLRHTLAEAGVAGRDALGRDLGELFRLTECAQIVYGASLHVGRGEPGVEVAGGDGEEVLVAAAAAVELAQQGMGAEEIAQVLTQQREKVCVVALLDTLEYLKKGGRISKTVAFAGGVLNIKPVVTVQDGAVALIGKARGSRNGNNLLVEKIREAGGVDFERPVLLGYTGLSSALLEKYVDDSKALWADHVDKLDGCLLCSVIGTHAGPGAVAVAFFRKG